MTQEIRIAPQNSLVLVMDPSVGEVPESMKGKPIASTRSCVAIGTLSEQDGETLISLSTDPAAVTPGEVLRFDGPIVTPSRRLSISTVVGIQLLAMDVPHSRARIRVWTNHETEPDEIHVIVGE